MANNPYDTKETSRVVDAPRREPAGSALHSARYVSDWAYHPEDHSQKTNEPTYSTVKDSTLYLG